ncbi:MAG: hypothetical protein Kow00121_64410 [Elainellaceae cyanobacterium]
MSSPSLYIRRVIVEGNLSCDLKFDLGLNIVQAIQTGDDPKTTNKCGKTALVELIQHGLGKRQKSKEKFHFAPISDQIETLWLEVETNGQVFTVERSLEELNSRVLVREGAYTSDIRNAPAEAISIEGLSSFFLAALDIPEVSVKTAEGSLYPLSFPTLMRAFILHQDDSFGQILDKMIPEQRRADVIGFLTRITPIERFSVEDLLAEAQVEAKNLENYFNSVQAFLTRNGVPSLVEAEARVQMAEEALRSAVANQRRTQQGMRQAVEQQSNGQQGRINHLRHQLFEIQSELANIERSFIGLEQEEKRLREVLASLKVDKQKAQRLQTSTTILSSVDFGICPRCLQEITLEMRQREQYAHCSLCNRPFRSLSDSLPRSAPKTEDIDLQIEEAETILQDVQLEKRELEYRLQRFRIQETEIGRELDAESELYVSPRVDQLLGQAYEVTRSETSLAQAQDLLRQAQSLDELKSQLNDKQQQQAEFEDQLREARKPYRTRLGILQQIYEQILREIDFPDFQSCTIDPNSFMPLINDSLYLHTGTALKGLATVAYHLAFLKLACREETFFPRLLVIDSPAVGDLNEENHDKLLRYLSRLQESFEESDSQNGTSRQIILTTRRIIPELEPYVIKRVSNSPNQKLLRRSN